MKKSLVLVLVIVASNLSAASFEFPICTTPGNQLYPDVCWDGEAFWVVWQDDSLGTIRGIRVNENGQLIGSEVELLEKGSDPGPVRYPCVAAAPDRIAVEARVMAGYNEFERELWGVMHNEFSFEGEPLYPEPARLPESFNLGYNIGSWVTAPLVLFGKEHFFSFLMIENETPVDVHSANYAIVLDSGGWYQKGVWQSSTIRFEDSPPVACWDGEKFFLVFYNELDDQKNKGVFIEDTFMWQGIGGQFDIGRKQFSYYTGMPKYQSLVQGGSRFFWASQAESSSIGFDILDSTGGFVSDSATILDFGSGVRCVYPDVMFNGENFLCVWENAYYTVGYIDIYTIKVDTFGNIIDSGIIVSGSNAAVHPALAPGRSKCLLVWSDNRNGGFDVYGMLLDAESIQEEPFQDDPFAIQALPNVFSNNVTFHLLTKGGKERKLAIYDALGRRVNALRVNPGEMSVVWNGRDTRGISLPAGVYFVSLVGEEPPSVSSIKVVKTR